MKLSFIFYYTSPSQILEVTVALNKKGIGGALFTVYEHRRNITWCPFLVTKHSISVMFLLSLLIVIFVISLVVVYSIYYVITGR
jgi:hypothetical protein